MTAPAFRFLGDGRRRRLGDGRVRSVGGPIPRYTDVGGTTGVGVGAAGHGSAWVPVVGETALSFALAATLDSAGTFGRTTLAVSVAGLLSAGVNLTGGAALAFGTFGRLSSPVNLSAMTSVVVRIGGDLSVSRSLSGETVLALGVAGKLSSATNFRGGTTVGFSLSGSLTASSASSWREAFENWYKAEVEGWAAVDANNRYLAQQAGNTAQAAADAIVVTNTRVEEVDDRVTAEASRTTALTTRVTNTETTNTAQGSAINALQTTTTSQGNLLTSHSSQLTGLSASITTLDGQVTNVANAQELMEVEVDSLGAARALRGVYLNVNGYISGTQSINDGITSEFNVMANVFRLLSPGATNGMEVQDGYMRVWRGGTQVVIGNGFGASGDLMLYAGPNVGVGNASKANATIWFDAAGSAYFGGTLSAGILKNAAQSSQISGTAQVETGAFGTNGDPKVVVYSLSYRNYGWSATDPGAATISATIVLERAIGGGGFTQVGTLNIVGNRTVGPFEPGLGYPVDVTIGGSATYTDNSTSTSDFNYRTRVTANSGWPWAISGGNQSQRLSVVSTEQG